jgi:hypothetical protein
MHNRQHELNGKHRPLNETDPRSRDDPPRNAADKYGRRDGYGDEPMRADGERAEDRHE